MTKQERISKITDLVNELDFTLLSPKCGNLDCLIPNEPNAPLVKIWSGNVHEFKPLDKLSSKDITKIYNDLKVDFAC